MSSWLGPAARSKKRISTYCPTNEVRCEMVSPKKLGGSKKNAAWEGGVLRMKQN
jgi:hypothetical protein